ncbi:MocE family 2Fe-2S type ferredoxin [Paraburkholderia tropica]|uniref:MocE family 2Fe-2S type ferredoxin n=1 Tax=Paraburkholderia tropica TaxID=92647 RepID=UPI002AB73BB3|nr:MocE family 2Fe-2S type ferredoxin [Paraburkholderia tropica]
MTEWVRVCSAEDLEQEDVKRFDHAGHTFAVYRGPDDKFYCTDGLCTHEAVHLADGFVMDFVVECPKHQGEFDYRTGETVRMPPCKNLKTYRARVENDVVFIEL